MSTGAQLKSIVERIERLEEERKGLGADIREIFAEAKGNGFDPKVLRLVLRKRKMAAADLAEQEALLETYEAAIESASQLPLFPRDTTEDQRPSP